MERLLELMSHVRRCHSATQIRHFIVVKGGAFCDYGALRQALRETHTRVGVVRECMMRIEEAELDLEEARDKLSHEDPIYMTSAEERELKRAVLEERRARVKLGSLKEDLTERAYELSHFYAVACALKDRVEQTHGTLTPERHAQLDATMWRHRLMLDAATDLRLHGKIQPSTLQSITSLPRYDREYMLSAAADARGLLEWAGKQDYDLPKIPKVLSGEEVCRHVVDADRTCIGAS